MYIEQAGILTSCFVAYHRFAGIIEASAAPTKQDARTQFIKHHFMESGKASSTPTKHSAVLTEWRKLKSAGWIIVPATITIEHKELANKND